MSARRELLGAFGFWVVVVVLMVLVILVLRGPPVLWGCFRGVRVSGVV